MYLNGIGWHAGRISSFVFEEEVLSISLRNINSYGQTRDGLNFGKVPIKNEGTYPLFSGPRALLEENVVHVSFSTTIAGDIAGATYDLVEEEPHELNIQILNLEEKIVEGSYKMTFVKVRDPRPELNLPDTIRITQGVFRSDITME